jgi:putative toxin-antitoxin system antitoxin component (TIGR02293 family)
MSRAEASKAVIKMYPLGKPKEDDFGWLHQSFSMSLAGAKAKAGATGPVNFEGQGFEVVTDGKGKQFIVVNFRKIYEADPLEQVSIVKRGVNARWVDVIASTMHVPKEKLIVTLGLGRATIQRKSSQQTALSSDESSRVMGVSKLIGQAQAMVEESGAPEDFDAAEWVAQWLDQPLPALNGGRPGDLMDTAEGQAMVSQLLSRLQSGAYA